MFFGVFVGEMSMFGGVDISVSIRDRASRCGANESL